MAYTGTGTQADPYIVDNWADFITVENLRYESFIKWADKENPAEKVVPAITISSRIDWRSAEIDFNGYVFEQITIDMNYTAGYYPIYILGSETKKAFNWHVLKWDIKNAQVSIFSNLIHLYNCYFDNLSCRPVTSNNILWTRSSSSPGVRVLHSCKFYNSVIKTYTEECNMIFPSAEFYNSELYVHYKYTGSTAISSKHSVFFTVQPSFYNCYVSGEIDVSEGSGSFAITDPVKSGGQWVVGAYFNNTIINIKFKVSANCSISAYNNNTRFAANTDNIKSYFTVDNGNNATGLSSIPAALKCNVSDIKNAQTLITDQFPHIEDNNVRYPQYSTDRSDEDWRWRQTVYINDGVPFLPFWFYPIYEPPVIYPIERAERISVYDILEPQNGFDHNGLAILFPSEVISYKEDMGRWDLELTHPIDPYGKWSYIVGQNTVKVNGQIFRIDETELYSDANQQYIKAHANHITYDLNDKFVGDASFSVSTGLAYEAQLMLATREMVPSWEPTPYEYQFEFASDITGTLVADVHDQTVTGALYGDDNSFATRYGGHLYRDNFHLSINSVQENLPAAPAFQLRFGTDLTKLSYKIDFSSWITELICENNFGELWACTYEGSEWMIHHHKTKRIHFTYPPGTPDTLQTLIKDGEAFWETVATPKISIEVAVANLKNDPKYKEFIDLQNLDVGYTGTVYFQQFNIDVDLKIVSIKRNELTGEAIQIILGNAPNSFIRSPVMSQTIVPNSSVESKQAQTVQAMQEEIENVKLKSMRLWSGIRSYTWADVNQYKWEEIKNGRRNS